LSPIESREESERTEEKTEKSGFTDAVRRVLGVRTGPARDDTAAIKVMGQEDLLVYRARCCSPIRGEDIVGYVTRGKGVAVHSKACPNMNTLMYDPERRIAVEWGRPSRRDGGAAPTYPVSLNIFCDDRFGMLKQIAAVISDDNTNIQNIAAHTGNLQATIDLVMDVVDLDHLERIIANLRRIPGVRDVQRVHNA